MKEIDDASIAVDVDNTSELTGAVSSLLCADDAAEVVCASEELTVVAELVIDDDESSIAL